MPKPKNAKVWNEDLKKALQAREDMARRQGKKSALTWHTGWKAIENVRGDIYTFSNGRIVNLPTLSKTVDNVCRAIIAGTENIKPAGHIDHTPETEIQGNPYLNYPYLNTIKKRGGAYAILIAFHLSRNQVLSKQHICEAAQPFCDEEMMENFHGGRMHGAWAANKTLIKHGLIVAHRNGGYNERAGGIRSLGPHTFTLTDNGKLFIEALLEKNPDIQRQIDAVRGTAGSAPTAVPFHPTAPVAKVPRAFAASSNKPQSKNSAEDEQELRVWAVEALIGHQKEFAVGKDRRKRLHDLCDELNSNILEGTGRQLRHESDGASRSRSLFITMIQSHATGVSAAPFPTLDESFDSVPSWSTAVKSSPPRPRSGRTLSESPAKRRAVPAKIAAANAALMRHEAFLEAKKPPPKVTPPSLCIDLLDDSDEEDEAKPAAKAAPTAKQTLFLDSDSDDDLPESVFRKKATHAPDNVSSGTLLERNVARIQQRHSAGHSDKPGPSQPIAAPVAAKARGVLAADDAQLIICIDDRERNRNHTPRFLRMELTRLLSTGPLSMVWTGRPAVVEERRLVSGDFSFVVTRDDSSPETALPVLIERKRIGDLVQRSYQKDHWIQLQRMQDGPGASFLLLEGDSRTTVQYTAYGAQEVESTSPFDHAIEDEDSLFRFFGRAILNDRSNSTRFVQTKDEQGSLRMVGAIGLISASSIQQPVSKRRADSSAERICLRDRLQKGGIPYQLAVRISDEIRSVKRMDLLYASIENESCRDRLFIPYVQDLCKGLKLAGTAIGWSRAIHRLWFSALPEPTAARVVFEQLCHLVEDHALLLEKLHMGLSPDEALDALLSSQQLLEDKLTRSVTIEVSEDNKDIFPASDGSPTFYHIQVVKQNQAIPCVSMQSKSGPYSSAKLIVCLMDGVEFVRRLQDAFTDEDFIGVARRAAEKIRVDFGISDMAVLLIRGLNPALDQAARQNGCRVETRVLVEMLQAELMISHDTIVLHATRLSGDRERMIQQLALACFHFQLLEHKES